MTTNTLAASAINFEEVMQFLQSASTYELFRLKHYIGNEIASPVRIEHIKAQLQIGQRVEYFSTRSQALHSGVVCKTNIKYAVIDADDGTGRWNVAYYSININSRPILQNTAPKLGALNKNNLAIGATVGFTNNGIDVIGTVTKLNPKTAWLLTTANERWNVYYQHLFPVIDGESKESRIFDVLPNSVD